MFASRLHTPGREPNLKRKAWYYMILDEAHMIKNSISTMEHSVDVPILRRLLRLGTSPEQLDRVVGSVAVSHVWYQFRELKNWRMVFQCVIISQYNNYASRVLLRPLGESDRNGTVLVMKHAAGVQLHTFLRPYLSVD